MECGCLSTRRGDLVFQVFIERNEICDTDMPDCDTALLPRQQTLHFEIDAMLSLWLNKNESRGSDSLELTKDCE